MLILSFQEAAVNVSFLHYVTCIIMFYLIDDFVNVLNDVFVLQFAVESFVLINKRMTKH